MTYIFKDIELDEKLESRNALTKIYGIGKSRANLVCNKLGFEKSVQLYKVTNYSFVKVVFLMKTFYNTELNLKQKLQMDLQILLDTKESYRCLRYKYYLPLRGQKTRTNAQTWKRRRRGSVKKKVARGKKR